MRPGKGARADSGRGGLLDQEAAHVLYLTQDTSPDQDDQDDYEDGEGTADHGRRAVKADEETKAEDECPEPQLPLKVLGCRLGLRSPA